MELRINSKDINNYATEYEYSRLVAGDVFVYEGSIYINTNHKGEAVSLISGKLLEFEDKDLVSYIYPSLTIDKTR